VTRTIIPAPERFWAKVDRSGGPDACWPWTAGMSHTTGYGGFHPVKGQSVSAHVYAWEQENGPVPPGAYVDHTCHNGTGCPGGRSCPHRRCCNPRHLDATTSADNVDRSHNANQHKTHCPRNHAYTPENTYYQRPAAPGRRPRRACRECARGYDRARAPRRKEARRGE
jgi:hypothetical protein